MSEEKPIYEARQFNPESALVKRFNHYTKVWGLKCNPFWYGHYCNYRAENEFNPENREKYAIIMLFVQAYNKEGTIFAAKRSDMEKWFAEKNLPSDLIQSGLSLGVLQVIDKEFIALSNSIMQLLW